MKLPTIKTRKRTPVNVRFWAKVHKSDDPNACWPFQFQERKDGYRTFSPNYHKSPTYAHRVAWTLTYGPIPEGLEVLHKCDNRPCCNPAHLFLGTQADNIKDKVAKNRQTRGITHGMSKLTEKQVLEIRQLRKEGMRGPAIAYLFNLTKENVYQICLSHTWTHV